MKEIRGVKHDRHSACMFRGMRLVDLDSDTHMLVQYNPG
jgi:hypothetical protein